MKTVQPSDWRCMLINIISAISILWPSHITSQERSDELSIKQKKTQWGKFSSFQSTLPLAANSNLTFTQTSSQSMNCIHFEATWQQYQVCTPEPVRLLGSVSWLILRAGAPSQMSC